ncbi:putative membrane domain protein, partial [Chlamydia psittaci 06-1683]
KIMRS